MSKSARNQKPTRSTMLASFELPDVQLHRAGGKFYYGSEERGFKVLTKAQVRKWFVEMMGNCNSAALAHGGVWKLATA